jgi:hypothetical protein
VIWRLAHPVRAMVTFVLVFVGLALVLGGFGIGLLELLVMALVATAAAFFANRESVGSPR